MSFFRLFGSKKEDRSVSYSHYLEDDPDVPKVVLLPNSPKNSRSARTSQNISRAPPAVHRRGPGRIGLTYALDNILVVGACPQHITQEQQWDEVAAFLCQNHSEHYLVWCINNYYFESEIFGNQVVDVKMPVPSWNSLIAVCASIDIWLLANPNNVAVIFADEDQAAFAVVAYFLYHGFATDWYAFC
eukprot:GCRY01007072.1.p1 GENE.GCRY01007072.1~~GCRY01007072.1.p1  ORF type:complete len:187 (+),score=7.67 GCRY01007072.1:71-631(+)